MFLFLFLFLFFAVLDDLCDNDDRNLATICEFRSELPSSNPVHLTLLGGTARLCRQAYPFSPCISLIFFYAFCSLFLLNFCLSIFFPTKNLSTRRGGETIRPSNADPPYLAMVFGYTWNARSWPFSLLVITWVVLFSSQRWPVYGPLSLLLA